MKKIITVMAVSLLCFGSSVAATLSDIERAMRGNDLIHAEQYARDVISKDVNDAKASYYLSQVLERTHSYKEAVFYLGVAKRIDPKLTFGSHPDKVKALEKRLSVHMLNFRTPEAEEAYALFRKMEHGQVVLEAGKVSEPLKATPVRDFLWVFVAIVLGIVAAMIVFVQRSNALRLKQDARRHEARRREQKAALTDATRILEDVILAAKDEHLLSLFDAALSLRTTTTESLLKLVDGMLLPTQDVEVMVSSAQMFKDLAENNRDYMPA